MNIKITDDYILNLDKESLRNFLCYNLDYFSFNNISENVKMYCVIENPFSVIYMNDPSIECLGRAIYLRSSVIMLYKNKNIFDGIEYAFDLSVRNKKLICFYNNIKNNCLKYKLNDQLRLIESLYDNYSKIQKEQYIESFDKNSMYDRIQHLELALSKITDYFNYEILDKRNNGINLEIPTSNDDFVEIITNIAKDGLKDNF